MQRATRSSIALFAIAALVLGGCGGGDDDGEASSSNSTSSTAPTEASGSTEAESSTEMPGLDACALIDDTTVEQVLGEPAEPTDGTTGDLYACSWEGVGDPLNVLSISVYAHPDAATAEQMYEETNEGLGGSEVAEVGDAATYSDAFGLDVLFDRYDISVDNTGPDEQQSDIDVARAIIGELEA
jgi:hypothetical protein